MGKTLIILLRWLHQRPTYLDLQSFLKRTRLQVFAFIVQYLPVFTGMENILILFIVIIAQVFIKIIPIDGPLLGIITFGNSKYTHNTSVLIYMYNKRALGPWVAHPRLTDQWSGTICKILVESIMRNNSKLF